MNEYKYTGSCHCGNIALEMKISSELSSYVPRACDCDFCLKHGATYVSDNHGKLSIFIRRESKLSKYKHGDKIADFLICQICGVLVGVCYENQGHLYATVNSRIFNHIPNLNKIMVVSPKRLNSVEKIERWKKVWFFNVALIVV